jgi:uncharacterized repeat protein (TIGR03803 family)
MTNPRPASISRIGLRAANIVLAIAVLLAVLGTQAVQAQTFSVLYAFRGSKHGGGPVAGLVLDAAGALYGTTVSGGNRIKFRYNGVVFKVDSHGNETVLHAFSGPDGMNPAAGVVRDAAGNLYGTTYYGGKTSKACSQGCGTVFKLNKARKETVLHSFNTVEGGENPYSDLIRDSDGNLYGTTLQGGKRSKACLPSYGCGTVFKLDKEGRFTVLYSFAGGTDGVWPAAGLYRDAAGNLYGTTLQGGSSNWGTVFKLDTTGKETVLYNFSNGPDGGAPMAGVIQDAAGNLYGTTTSGGLAVCGGAFSCGVVFKLDPKGNETVLHAFTGSPDGAYPQAALIQDAAGNLFGTTKEGGPTNGESNGGTVFKIDANGIESVLYRFDYVHGAYPEGHLVQDSAGNLYGTAVIGGNNGCGGAGCGTVFKITP